MEYLKAGIAEKTWANLQEVVVPARPVANPPRHGYRIPAIAQGGPLLDTGRVRTAIGILLAIAAAALALGSSSPAPSADASRDGKCDRFASPRGKNSAPGTRQRPVRTAHRLVRALRPGDRGCFRRGRYGFGLLNVNKPRVTLAPYRGAPVKLHGDIKVLPGGVGSAILGLRLNGAGGKHEIGPRIYADNVLLRGNVITNHHQGICVQLSSYFSQPAPRGVQINRNRIHDCGRLPATNHDHGIYVAQGQRTSITNNWIYDNADRGIQLYPGAQDSVVRKNVIDSNGQGVSIGGRGGLCANGNNVARNVIANARIGWNVYSNTQGSACAGNVVRRNCVYAGKALDHFGLNGGVQTPSRNFAAEVNRIARPRYRGRDRGDLRLRQGSRCARLLQVG